MPVVIDIDVTDAKLNDAIVKMQSIEGKGGQVAGENLPVSPGSWGPLYEETRRLDPKDWEVQQQKAGELEKQTSDSIAGLNLWERKLASMTPGVREVYQIYRDMEKFLVNPVNLIGAMGLFQLVLLLYQRVTSYIQQQERQQAEYQQAVMQLQNFSNSSQFAVWESSQRQAAEGYRRNVVP